MAAETDSKEWLRLIVGDLELSFDTPDWNAEKGVPRRLTAQHVHDFATFMETMARTWWESADKKKPYKVGDVHFRARYINVAVDSDE